jgi:RNA polymerase sigma-70 factor, ECF subfamily
MCRDATFTEMSRSGAMAGAAAEFVVDEDVFRGFYERNARGLWAYLAHLTGDRAQADDLMQEAFYRFLRAASAYESEAHRRNSLYRIATNLARDARRRSRTGLTTAGVPLENVSGGDQAGRIERHADLKRALAGMKPRERAMLWLAYAEGASHDEIAGVLGLRTASLKSLLSRARGKMAALLGRKTGGGNA